MPTGHLGLPSKAAGRYRAAWAPPRKRLTPASVAAVGMLPAKQAAQLPSFASRTLAGNDMSTEQTKAGQQLALAEEEADCILRATTPGELRAPQQARSHPPKLQRA